MSRKGNSGMSNNRDTNVNLTIRNMIERKSEAEQYMSEHRAENRKYGVKMHSVITRSPEGEGYSAWSIDVAPKTSDYNAMIQVHNNGFRMVTEKNSGGDASIRYFTSLNSAVRVGIEFTQNRPKKRRV